MYWLNFSLSVFLFRLTKAVKSACDNTVFLDGFSLELGALMSNNSLCFVIAKNVFTSLIESCGANSKTLFCLGFESLRSV